MLLPLLAFHLAFAFLHFTSHCPFTNSSSPQDCERLKIKGLTSIILYPLHQEACLLHTAVLPFPPTRPPARLYTVAPAFPLFCSYLPSACMWPVHTPLVSICSQL